MISTDEKRSDEKRRQREETRKWWREIGVEPVMFLYMSAFMITSVVEEAFFVYKACRVNLGFSEEICRNISNSKYADYKTQVQLKVSSFHQYENIASHAVPVVLAFFLGSWSDRVGRKLPLMLGLFGSFIYSSMIVVNALMETWPVETILYTASFPCAITGGSLSIFMSAFSYLADTTSQKSRTKRTTLLEVAYLIPMPAGVALGSYLFSSVFHGSYALMFTLNASLLVLAMITTGWLVKWKTTGVDRESTQLSNSCCDLVSLKHVYASIRALVRPRTEKRRLYLALALIAMALYTFQRDEKHMVYLYTQYKFDWDVTQFSRFRTFQSIFFVVGLLIAVPILGHLLQFKDTSIMALGACSHILGRIFFATADTPSYFYVGAVAAVLGPIVAPVLRSFLSKLVPSSDRGKVFAVFTVADTTIPILSGFVYSQVYNSTLTSFPEAIFVVTAASQFCVLIIALLLNFFLKGQNIRQATDEDPIMPDMERITVSQQT